MNYLPARITWLMITVIAAMLPRFSGSKAWRVGLGQHALLHGPNSGWSEASAAGALQRRIVGPIWLNGALVTDLWIGDPSDPPLATSGDVMRALTLCVLSGLGIAALATLFL
jgi:adenosylcobinamide-phosphate synthase